MSGANLEVYFVIPVIGLTCNLAYIYMCKSGDNTLIGSEILVLQLRSFLQEGTPK